MIIDFSEFEIIDGDRGKNYPNKNDLKKEGYCLFLNAKNVTKKGFSDSVCEFINQEKDSQLRKGKIFVNDIIITTRGTIGNISLITPKIFEKYKNIRINSGMVIVRQNKIDPNFLYIIFNSKLFKNKIKEITTGGVLPQITITSLKKIRFQLNFKKEQENIIFSKISNQSDTLLNIENLLEKIEIRNNYYADKLLSGELSIDEDGQLLKSNNLYDYKNLGELCDIKTGRKDANAGSEEGLYSFFTCSQETKKINEYSFDCEAILIAGNGIPGVCKYINGKFDAYQRVYVLNNFKENVSYIYKYMNSKFKKQIDNETQGAVIQYIKIDNIKDFKIAIPDEKTQNNIIKFLDNLENEKSKVEKLLELEEKRFEWLSDKLLSGEYIIED